MDMICTVITSGNITEELLLLLVMLKRVSHFTSGSHSWFTHTTGSHFTRSQFVSYQTPPQTTRTPVIVAATQTPVINNTTICI